MKKLLFVFGICFAGTVSAACPGGATCGAATKYDVRLLEAALCQDAACATGYVVGSASKSFDIASATVGSALGSYAKLDSLPAGVFTYIKVVIDRTFGITGTAAGCAAQTASSPISVPNGIPIDGLNGMPGMSWNDPATKAQIKIIQVLPTPLVISKAGSRPTITVKFDTQEGLMCVGGAPYPKAPSATITVEN